MRFLKQKLGRTTGPVLVCAAILAVLGITAAVAAPKFITGKKVVTTIVKKVQGQELQVASQKDLLTPSFDVNQPSALVADLRLPKGSYMVHSTATVTRPNGGVVVQCQLQLGKRLDRTDISGGAAGNQDMALGISAGIPANSGAQLRCVDGTALSDGKVANIEISAIRVPKLTLNFAP